MKFPLKDKGGNLSRHAIHLYFKDDCRDRRKLSALGIRPFQVSMVDHQMGTLKL
jgi:hypothetical protein